MISTLKNLAFRLAQLQCALVLLAILANADAAFADSVSLSVTPTLIEISAEPGKTWESSIKVINNNPFALTVYTNVVNFAPQGEGGQGAFSEPHREDTDGATIASWLTLPAEPITIPRESSASVPIKLVVPRDAAPGGHYAAIQVGTKPLAENDAQAVRTSQIVTSLFFARVAGDINENGTIRSFSARQTLVGRPEAAFELRFENKGNVHLQPQGEIVIKNMWGTERGIIPINQQTHFGNVLPESIRKFEFTWSGVFSLADVGRYTAEVTLGYGSAAKQFVSQETNFYVIPLKALALFAILLIAAAYFVRLVIRSYVRRMLYLAGVDPDIERGVLVPVGKLPGRDVRIKKRSHVTAPVRAGFGDLKTRLAAASGRTDRVRVISAFVSAYKLFFISLGVLLACIILLLAYFRIVTDSDVPYEVTIEHAGEPVTISSE